MERLEHLIDLGLDYLSLSRETDTPSGGESPRIKRVKRPNVLLAAKTYASVFYDKCSPLIGVGSFGGGRRGERGGDGFEQCLAIQRLGQVRQGVLAGFRAVAATDGDERDLRPLLRAPSPGGQLPLAQRRWQSRRQRIGAGTRDEQRQGNQQHGERVFEAALAPIKPVRQVHQKDGPQHDDDDARRPQPDQDPAQHRQPAANLRQAQQVADHGRHVQMRRKPLRAGTAKSAKEDRAAVVEDPQGAGNPKDQERGVELRGPWGSGRGQ